MNVVGGPFAHGHLAIEAGGGDVLVVLAPGDRRDIAPSLGHLSRCHVPQAGLADGDGLQGGRAGDQVDWIDDGTNGGQLLAIGQNRLELLSVEVQEERERLLHAFLLALGVAVFGLLAAMTLTAAIVWQLWTWSPVGVLLILTFLYGAIGAALYWRLAGLLRDWQTLPASLDQLRKDRACLEKILK